MLGQMAMAGRRLGRTEGCLFHKLCGSGTGEGFTPRPNLSVWAILAEWADTATAAGRTAEGVHAEWRARSAEAWTVFLRPLSRRGAWGGAAPFAGSGTCEGPVAALTRASLRPRHLARFWARVPDISAAIGSDPSVIYKIGIGEVPLLHQVTFSIWPDAAAMAGFARADGPHARAISAVRDGDWFAEELYARFAVIGQSGHLTGAPDFDPLPEAA